MYLDNLGIVWILFCMMLGQFCQLATQPGFVDALVHCSGLIV